MALQAGHVVGQPLLAHDEVDCVGGVSPSGAGRVEMAEPLVELLDGAGVRRREGPDDPGGAGRPHQRRPRHPEHRRSDQWKPEPTPYPIGTPQGTQPPVSPGRWLYSGVKPSTGRHWRLGALGLSDGVRRRLRLPLIAAPMFRVSGPALVRAACAAGIIGAFPTANARTVEELDEWLGHLDAAGAAGRHAPYAVNLIMRQKRLADDVACLERHRVEVVITSVGSPEPVLDRLHA